MNSIRQLWLDAMQDPATRWIVAIFVLITVILVAVYVAKWFRDLAIGGGLESVSHLSEFERLHAEGKLNADEYQRLKKTIPLNIQTQSKSLLTEHRREKKDLGGNTAAPQPTEMPDFTESKDSQ